MSAREIREIVTDRLGRFNNGPTICSVCQTPLEQSDAVDVDGEPAHRDCIRFGQSAARTATTRNGGLIR